jgi:putative tryptophan/tyrosine transport system substrate-binding protein
VKRREFITLIGGAAAWPLVAQAQQATMPVIGFLSSASASPSSASNLLSPFRQGLEEGGYVEGRNLVIEYRWAGGRSDRLPELVADLARREVALIVAGGFEAAMAAKAATQTIPLLFIAGFDPVKMGLVTSLSRPGGNATGVSVYTIELLPKRVELLLSVVPKAATVALLVHPNPYGSELEIEHIKDAARARDFRLVVLKANVENDLEAAFASAAQQGVGALTISADPFFMPRHTKIVALAARYELPTVYPWRIYVEDGGLMSYGPTIAWAYHQVGLYASRILKRAKPDDLPVQLPTKFEFVINLKTAKALGLDVPPSLLARADEVIE